ncbi:MAG: ATP-dependent DNA helicase RecG [Candidatus Omnitrophica bacterium]|nr:ATP-dependent DNA helicase RecG [Candidatus Omnitrophota bacterium]
MTPSQVPTPNISFSSTTPHTAQPRESSSGGSPGDTSIRYVKGVGPHRMTQLAQLDIVSVEDACYTPPRRYEDRTHLLPISEVRPGSIVTVRGRILTKTLRRIRRGQTIFEAAIGDETGTLYGVWFNQPYLAQQLQVGESVIFYGQVELRPRLQMIHPEMERIEGEERDSVHMGRIVPIYPLVAGVGQRWFRQMMATVVERYGGTLQDTLPEPIRQARGWPRLAQAIRDLHFPSAWEALERAQQRLAFEELFLFQLALAQRRARTGLIAKPHHYQLDGPITRGLRETLPFTLTASQTQVLDHLLADLAKPSPMHRLLQGDVGCGKTIVMIALIAVAVQSGYQVALMAPTELLAEQHARVIESLLGPLGVTVGLISQGVAAAERARRAEAIATGALSVVVGTHALIQSQVVFRDLALVLIDEQHKFGVVQRAHLAKKAQAPDVLVVTATPIPRTLALSIYGDLDVSTIQELPTGRQPIKTLWMANAEREELYAMVRKELARGRQAYIVYPLVDEHSTKELRAATQMAKQLQTDVFPKFRVGLLHGQMKPQLKEKTMLAFAKGELQALVSTVIVEVGLDVPNATVMVIEHPERFGLAQLHQLRGRIGRGTHPATCILITDSGEAGLNERLSTFVRTTDGFALAEKDLELRGPGELLGRRQHGWLRFRIANLSRDTTLLESAREEAATLIVQDPDLRASSLAPLRAKLSQFRRQPG